MHKKNTTTNSSPLNKISAVIITRNEEQNIGRCLASLINVADEVIVIDSFSTDRTEAICKQYQVVFVKRKFVGYSDAKNYGGSLANYPYIFSIDADEALSDELKQSIITAKENLTATDGYQLYRKTNYCGKWINYCGWYPEVKLRLWQKDKAQWQGAIHETLALPSGSSIKLLKGDLLHYSYPDMGSHIKKIDTYTTQAAANLYKKGRRVSVPLLVAGPVAEFMKKYFFQLGILDGYQGFVISVMSGYYKFLKFAKLKDLYRQAESKPE